MVIEENKQTVHSGAQEPTVYSKSFAKIFFGLFTYTFGIIKLLFVKPKDVMYVNPEISIEFKSDTIGVYCYSADGRGSARLKLILPEGCTKLNHFQQTPYSTELLATYIGNHTGMPNLGSTTNVPQTTTNSGSTQTGTSMPNLGSTTNVPQTTTDNSVSTQPETSVPHLSSTTNVHQTTTNNSGSTQIETIVDILASSNTVHQTTEYKIISTVKVKGMTSLVSAQRVHQNEEHEMSSTQSENGIDGLISRMNAHQVEEDDSISMQVKNIHNMETDKYEARFTQSENGIDSLISRINSHQAEEYDSNLMQIGKKNKRRHCQGTAIATLKWNRTKRLNLNQKQALVHTAKYQIEGCSYSKDTCRLFINDCGLFSDAAFRHLYEKNSNNIYGRWSLFFLSKSEKHLYIERIDDLPPTILYKITEPLQNHKDGKQRKRLEDVITFMEINEHRAKHPTNSIKGDLNIDDDIETDNNVPHNLNYNIPEEQITRDTDVETDDKIPQNLDSNIPEERIPHDQLQTVPSKKKQNDQLWMQRIKMKQAKVKTRSLPTEFKIYLQSHDDEVQDLVNDYFREDNIRQCVQDFFESDVNPIRRQKRVFERPHIQWPSMHPRLPYKLRYLDEHVEDNGSGNQDHVQQQTFSPTASGEYNEERSSDSISLKSDSSDDETK